MKRNKHRKITLSKIVEKEGEKIKIEKGRVYAGKKTIILC